MIQDYLTNRKQCVKLGNSVSSLIDVKIGIPQGSILGPLLFLIYVNDLPNVSDSFFSTLFADDTTLTFKFASFENLESSCNAELQKFYQWTLSNRLTINFDKTFYMIICNRIYPSNLNISIDSRSISKKTHVGFLGVEYDSNLKFGFHVQNISKKICL